MGTNYYRKRIPTEAERDELHTLLDKYMDGKVQDYEFRERFEQINEEIHICKTSWGWQVCFDHHWGEYYQPNRKDLERFLSETNTVIEDEYGERFTPEEFWDIVENHNSHERNRWTAKTYRLWEEAKGAFNPLYPEDEIRKCESMFGVQCYGETDFCVDGLRFAVYSDFS